MFLNYTFINFPKVREKRERSKDKEIIGRLNSPNRVLKTFRPRFGRRNGKCNRRRTSKTPCPTPRSSKRRGRANRGTRLSSRRRKFRAISRDYISRRMTTNGGSTHNETSRGRNRGHKKGDHSSKTRNKGRIRNRDRSTPRRQGIRIRMVTGRRD